MPIKLNKIQHEKELAASIRWCLYKNIAVKASEIWEHIYWTLLDRSLFNVQTWINPHEQQDLCFLFHMGSTWIHSEWMGLCGAAGKLFQCCWENFEKWEQQPPDDIFFTNNCHLLLPHMKLLLDFNYTANICTANICRSLLSCPQSSTDQSAHNSRMRVFYGQNQRHCEKTWKIKAVFFQFVHVMIYEN